MNFKKRGDKKPLSPNSIASRFWFSGFLWWIARSLYIPIYL